MGGFSSHLLENILKIIEIMIKMTKVIVGALILLFCACSINKDHDRMGVDIYTFQLGDSKMIYLDSMTTQESNYMQLINSNQLGIYNQPAHTICIFDIGTGKEVKKVQLYKEGPNAVIDIQGFYYQSEDSIWLYRSWQQEFVLINEYGEIIDRKMLADKLPPIDKHAYYSVAPFPLTDLPILKIENTLILQGMNGPEVENGLLPATTILYDFNSNKIRLANPYPNIYGDEINERWGTFSYRVTPYTLNEKNEMIVSFPADDSIRVYSIKEESYMSYFAGYSAKTNIKPLSLKSSQTDLQEQYLEQYQYAGILHDKFHNLYYRLVMLPTFDYDIRKPNTQYKELAIIILNSSFEKVGEYTLEKACYKYRNIFVSEDGLHINIQSDDDDYLKFVTLNVVEK